MKKNNIKKLTLGLALVGAVGLAGVSAYFSDTDSATNTFTIGKVSQQLQEPSWVAQENIEPGAVMAKDPQVLNDGINDQYVFMTVKVPHASLVTNNADGRKNPAADTELFSYSVNEGWTQLGDKHDNSDGTYTYTYYYGSDDTLTALAAAETTESLFDTVTFCNAVEGQGLEEQSKDIVVNSYGIQTENLGSDVTPSAVWTIVQNTTASN